MALEDSMVAGDSYKKVHDAKANHHILKEDDYAYLDNQLFFGKNKKICSTMDWAISSEKSN
jgi:hypothetical protein